MNISATAVPTNANPKHYQEWLASGVDPAIFLENVLSLEGQAPYDYLLYSDLIPRRNDGRVAQWVLNRYTHVEQGGWWCSGEDLVKLKRSITDRRIESHANETIQFNMMWGQFKPDQPFVDKDGKLPKYETPLRTETRTIALRDPVNPRFWLEVLSNPAIPIVICEGAKKAGCLFTLGYAAIALPGIFNGYRKATQKLIEDLAVICAPGRPIYICFDHDTKKATRQNVNKAISRLGKLFAIAGCAVKVIDLPGPEKGVDDFVVARGREAFDSLYEKALLLSQWQTKLYSQLTYEVNLDLNQRFLGSLNLPSDRRLFGIKSPKGTGKTEALKEMVAGAMERGQRVLLLTHRVQLGQAICDRVGLNYVTELRGSDEGALFGYGLCIDSLHPDSQARFNAEEWQDAIVIIDEAEQVIWHLLNANTEVNTHRLVILDQLKQLLFNTLTSEIGQVLLLDADLTDVSVNFVKKLSGGGDFIDPWICVNRYDAAEKRTCYNFNDSKPKAWYTELNRLVDDDKKLFIVTQSQKKKSTYSAHNMAKDIGRRHPTKRILVIDSETISDPNHPAYCCTSDLNKIVTRYDLVLVTPTIGTGVSIDVRGHFDAVFGCFWGVDSADAARQSLARIRDDIPRYVWAARFGIGRIANGSTSKFGLRNSQTQLATAAIGRLAAWWEDEEGYKTNDAALQTWAEMACRVNGQMIDYRESVVRGLEGEGYEVVAHEVIPDADLSDSLAETKASEYQQDSENEVAASLIDDTKGEELRGKRSKTPEERLQLRKWKRHKKYGLEVDVDLIERDDNDWFPQIQLYYYLFIGRRFLERRDAQALHSASRAHQVWYPSLNQSQIGIKVAMFEFLDVQSLLDEEREFKNSDQDMAIRLEKAIANREVLKDLGITISDKDSAIAIGNKLLKKIGLKLVFSHKQGKRGANERVYRLEALADKRFEAFDHWLERDERLSRNHTAVGATLNSKSLNREAA